MTPSKESPFPRVRPVFLLCFVLMLLPSLVLGLLTWIAVVANGRVTEERDRLQAVVEARDEIARERDQYQELAELRRAEVNREKVLRAHWRLVVGLLENEDIQDLQAYQKSYAKEWQAEKQKSEEVGIVWERDPKKGDLPTYSLKALIDELKQRQKELETSLERERREIEQLNQVVKQTKALKDAAEKRAVEFDGMLKETQKKLEGAIEDNALYTSTISKLEKENQDLESKRKIETEAHSKEVEELKAKLRALEEKKEP